MSFSIAKLIEERQADQYDLHMKYISPHMARVQKIIGFDKIYVRGEGAYLWDIDGVRYLDLLAGYSVFNLGREHPVIKQAMLEYLNLERPTLVKMDCPLLAGLLAEQLVKRMPPGLDAIFFANSGADAVDTAIKFARYATRRPRVVYLDHSFHGLTLGTLSINGGEDFKKGFDPLISGTVKVAMNDLEFLEKELRKGDVAALIVEPIQGKGVYIPEESYLPKRSGYAGNTAPSSFAMKSRWAWGVLVNSFVANIGILNRIWSPSPSRWEEVISRSVRLLCAVK